MHAHSKAPTTAAAGAGPDAAKLAPLQALPVYRAQDFRVTDGANLGDALADADDLVPDDIYELREGARRARLTIADPGSGPFVIADGSELGHRGNLLHLDSCLTLMSRDGTTFDVLVLAEVAPADHTLEQIFLLPLAPLHTRRPYRLVGIDRDSARARFAEVACVSFSRGTHIAMADGQQRLIEDLRIGDRILTRDSGARAIRWIGRTTQRAVGEFAPIVITRGTLNNENDLTLSPNHRLFIYQRQDEMNAGRAEILVQVRHLLNGTTVYRQDGGFVDYFQLLFDRHEIIYAEGIAAESLLLDRRTSAALPNKLAGELAGELAAELAEKAHPEKLRQGLAAPGRANFELEVEQSLLKGADTPERLRRASLGEGPA